MCLDKLLTFNMISDKNRKMILTFDEMFTELSRETDNSFSIGFGEDDKSRIIHKGYFRLC